MEQQLDNFIHYLEAVRKSSRNTILSYKRDLEKFAAFLDAQAVVDLADVNETTMNAYILMMETVCHIHHFKKYCRSEVFF